MPSLKKKATAAKLRAWHASLMRARNHHLGIVYAPHEASGRSAAIAEFKIGEDMRRRLVVRSNESERPKRRHRGVQDRRGHAPAPSGSIE